MERRELFSSLTSSLKKDKEEKLEAYVRPPYFKNDSDFTENCHTCIDKSCEKACDVEIIVIKEDGTPILNFANSGCTYCDDCALACKPNVLTIENKKNINAKFNKLNNTFVN